MSTQTSRSKSRRSTNKNKRVSGANNARGLVSKHQLTGGRFSPPSNPPDVTYQPWIPLTVVISHSDHLPFQVNDMRGHIRRQVDPTGRGFNQSDKGDNLFVIQYRLLSIMAWNLNGRVISLSVDDFTDNQADAGGRDQLCGLIDTGTQYHTPAVGYTLPLAAQQHVLRTDSLQGKMYLFDVNGPSGQYVTYVKILYRFDGPIKHPSILSPIQEIDRTLTKISNKILKQKEPSTLELTFNGVKYVAEAVAILSADCSELRISDPVSAPHSVVHNNDIMSLNSDTSEAEHQHQEVEDDSP